jgi:uncharacterized protein YndB with AHSA1/START domain
VPFRGYTLHVERAIAAPRDKVFAAWVDEGAVRSWFVHNAPVRWDTGPRMAPKRGGHFEWRVAQNQDRAIFDFTGTYHIVRRPESLAFTWHWDHLPIEGVEGAGDTEVLLRLVPAGRTTRIQLTQTGLPTKAARAAHLKGWNRCLDGIEALLTGTAAPSPTE